MKYTQTKIYYPLIISEIYLFFSVLLFTTGPYKWYDVEMDKVLLYIVILYVSFALGYIFYIRKQSDNNHYIVKNLRELRYTWKISFLLNLGILIALIVWWQRFYALGGELSLSALINPAMGYYGASENTYIASGISKLGILFWGLSYFVIPIALIYWKKIAFVQKVLFIIYIFSGIITYLGTGTMKLIGDLIISISVVTIAKASAFHNEKHVLNGNIKPKKRTLFIPLMLLILAFICFNFIQSSRMEFKDIDIYKVTGFFNDFGSFDDTNLWIVLFGPTIVHLCGYISNGYAGLGLAMNLPFEWTYGFGFSRALTEYGEQYLNFFDPRINSYLFRNELISGWPAGVLWSTAFVWFASDVSYAGVVLLLFCVGVFFASVWKDYLNRKSLLTLTILTQISIFIVYLPANNQLFQSKSSFHGTILIMIIYLIDYLLNRKVVRKVEQ